MPRFALRVLATARASRPGLEVSKDALVAAADAALYGATRAGRNRVLASLQSTLDPQGMVDAGAVSIVVDARTTG